MKLFAYLCGMFVAMGMSAWAQSNEEVCTWENYGQELDPMMAEVLLHDLNFNYTALFPLRELPPIEELKAIEHRPLPQPWGPGPMGCSYEIADDRKELEKYFSRNPNMRSMLLRTRDIMYTEQDQDIFSDLEEVTLPRALVLQWIADFYGVDNEDAESFLAVLKSSRWSEPLSLMLGISK